MWRFIPSGTFWGQIRVGFTWFTIISWVGPEVTTTKMVRDAAEHVTCLVICTIDKTCFHMLGPIWLLHGIQNMGEIVPFDRDHPEPLEFV